MDLCVVRSKKTYFPVLRGYIVVWGSVPIHPPPKTPLCVMAVRGHLHIACTNTTEDYRVLGRDEVRIEHGFEANPTCLQKLQINVAIHH